MLTTLRTTGIYDDLSRIDAVVFSHASTVVD